MEALYQGKNVFCIGAANKKPKEVSQFDRPVFQGKCAIIAKDGSFLIEGCFFDGSGEGPQRLIKASKRKPGRFTVREGMFSNGLEVD